MWHGQRSGPRACVAQSSLSPLGFPGCGHAWLPPSFSLWQGALGNRSYGETKSKQPSLSPGTRPRELVPAAVLRQSVGLWVGAGSRGHREELGVTRVTGVLIAGGRPRSEKRAKGNVLHVCVSATQLGVESNQNSSFL